MIREWVQYLACLIPLLVAGTAAADVPLTRFVLGVQGGYSPLGMQINAVAPGSPAEKIGLQRGDLILKIDGRPVTNQQEFSSAIDGSQGTVALIVRKVNSRDPVKLVAELAPTNPAVVPNRLNRGPYLLGVIGSYTPQGMRIGHVVPGTPAERIGLKANDTILTINGLPIRNQNEMNTVLNTSGGQAALQVRKGTNQLVQMKADLATHQLGVLGEFTRDGLHVEVISPGTPAERFGIQRGDLIARIDNQLPRNQTELDRIVQGSGGSVTLIVRRGPNGQPGRLVVDVTNNPLGAWCEPIAEGMRVTNVALGSPADRIGLERGDLILRVDDKPVRSQGELTAALFNAGGFVTLFVRKASHGRVVRVDADLAR